MPQLTRLQRNYLEEMSRRPIRMADTESSDRYSLTKLCKRGLARYINGGSWETSTYEITDAGRSALAD